MNTPGGLRSLWLVVQDEELDAPAGGLGSCSRDLDSRVRDSAGARGYGAASPAGDRAVVQQRGGTAPVR